MPRYAQLALAMLWLTATAPALQSPCATIEFQVAVTPAFRLVALDEDVLALVFDNEVVIYRDLGPQWVEEARVSSPFVAPESIDLAGDDLIVGKRSAGPAGSAVVFTRSGTTWVQEAVLQPSDGQFQDEFGTDVAIDGDVAVVGAAKDGTVHGFEAGSAYVFRRSGTTWTQGPKLVPPDGTDFAAFGHALDVLDGTLVVGSWNWNAGPGLPFTGKAYVYTQTGNAWALSDELMPVTDASEFFGRTVSLDGMRLAISSDDFFDGETYVFRKDPQNWTLEDTVPVDQTGPFGNVDLAGDALVGSEKNGPLRIYRRSGTDWNLTFDGGYSPRFSLSADRLATVSFFTATVLSFEAPPTTYCTAKTNSQGCTPRTVWSGTASTVTAEPFDIRALDVLNRKNGLFFYGVQGPANVPFLGGLLCVQPSLQRTELQNSLGNLPPDDCSGVHTFDFNARIQSGADPALTPGTAVHGQYWSRDPQHPDGTGVSLSNAITFEICE